MFYVIYRKDPKETTRVFSYGYINNGILGYAKSYHLRLHQFRKCTQSEIEYINNILNQNNLIWNNKTNYFYHYWNKW